MNSATPASTLDTLREQFVGGLLNATAATERLATTTGAQRAESEEVRASLRAMHEAFDRLVAIAAAPTQAPQPDTVAARLGPALPGWEMLNRANPMVESRLIDTICLVKPHLEGLAFTLEHLAGNEVPSVVAAGLSQSLRIAICALDLYVMPLSAETGEQ